MRTTRCDAAPPSMFVLFFFFAVFFFLFFKLRAPLSCKILHGETRGRWGRGPSVAGRQSLVAAERATNRATPFCDRWGRTKSKRQREAFFSGYIGGAAQRLPHVFIIAFCHSSLSEPPLLASVFCLHSYPQHASQGFYFLSFAVRRVTLM